MRLVDDQEAVEQFAADGADEAFGDRVRSRCAHRRLDDLDDDGGGELVVVVADQEPERPVGVVEVHEQVAGLLGQPRSGRVRGDAQDVHSAGGVLDDEERVEPVQRDRVAMEQVAGQDRLGLRVEELGPGRPAPPRRRLDARRVENPPHCGGADLVAESDEFPVHPPIPQVGFWVARRTVRARTPGGWRVGLPARARWSSGVGRAGGASAGSSPG